MTFINTEEQLREYMEYINYKYYEEALGEGFCFLDNIDDTNNSNDGS